MQHDIITTTNSNKLLFDSSRSNGHGVSETARNLGINANMLSRWKREDEAKQNGGASDNHLSPEERDELRQLRSEVKQLRLEREIFKKALGYFANESN